MNVTAVDHVEFYVRDAPETARFLCEAFGFRRLGQGGPGTGLPGQRTLLLGQGGIRILVTSALAPDHPVARHVERHGDGLACVAMRTDDAAAAFERALADGGDRDGHGSRVGEPPAGPAVRGRSRLPTRRYGPAHHGS
jgi:4-hydroxymandelate synthase